MTCLVRMRADVLFLICVSALTVAQLSTARADDKTNSAAATAVNDAAKKDFL